MGISIPRMVLRAVRSASWGRTLRAVVFCAVLGGVGLGASYGISKLYGNYRDRTLDLCVVTDADYRVDHPDWAINLKPIFADVNRMFQKTGVQWRVKQGGEAYPPNTQGDLFQRAALLRDVACTADVILGLTSRADRHADSVASPFSHTLLVSSPASDTEAMAAITTAGALGKLFGVQVNPRTMIVTGASEGIFDAAAIRLIHEMRQYDFADGIDALPGRWEERAEAALTESLTGKKAHPDAEARRILARAFAAERKHSDAIRELRQALQTLPNDFGLRFDLGMQLAADSETQAALGALADAAGLDPSNAEPHAAAGGILLNANRVDEAVEEFRKAAALDPHNSTYQAALGVALSRQSGGAREAAAAFQEAVRLRPMEPGAAQGLMLESNVEQTLQQAVQQLQAQLRQKPDSAENHLRLGIAHGQAGDFQASEKELRRAIELQPDFGDAHLALARTYYLMERYADAQKELNAARAAGVVPPGTLIGAVEHKLSAGH
ncbi:MAG TPA: tetratricopeptide repeat protein [Bryobacteraceae bacterium]|nr:tetratricopeptide repeat protein [Bryobacteraceae bacterium]